MPFLKGVLFISDFNKDGPFKSDSEAFFRK